MHVTTRQGAREAVVLPSVRTPAPTVIVLHGAAITQPVALLRLEGHQFPGRPQCLPGLLDLGSLQINAAEEAMEMVLR